MGAGTRQDVTGLVVNKQPAVARHERRRFRAWLHGAEAARAKGAEVPAWTNAKGAHSDALGFASYLAMVDAKHGAPLVARTKAVYRGARTGRSSVPATTPTTTSRAAFRKAAGEGRAPSAKWWTPAERTAPQMELIATPKAAAQATAQGASVVPPISSGGNTARTARASRWGAGETRPNNQELGQLVRQRLPARQHRNFGSRC